MANPAPHIRVIDQNVNDINFKTATEVAHKLNLEAQILGAMRINELSESVESLRAMDSVSTGLVLID